MFCFVVLSLLKFVATGDIVAVLLSIFAMFFLPTCDELLQGSNKLLQVPPNCCICVFKMLKML